MLGSAMAVITSNAIGSIRDAGAVAPAVRAAIRKVAAWPATASTDASTMPGHARRESSPSRMSPAAAPRTRALADRAPSGRARATSAMPSTATTTPIATSGMTERTGDGSASRTTTVTRI